MSGGQEQRIQPEVLLAQLQALRDRLNQLQAYGAQLEQLLASLRAAIAGVESLSEESEIMTPLDPNMNAFARVKVASSKVAVGIGRGIYVALDKENALELLRRRELEYTEAINKVKSEIEKLSKAYAQLAQELEALQQSAVQRGGGRGGEA